MSGHATRPRAAEKLRATAVAAHFQDDVNMDTTTIRGCSAGSRYLSTLGTVEARNVRRPKVPRATTVNSPPAPPNGERTLRDAESPRAVETLRTTGTKRASPRALPCP